MTDYDPALIALAEFIADKQAAEVWREDAACLGFGTEVFFPDPGSAKLAEEAKRICSGCPVKSNCLRMAVEEDLRDGIFGGMTFAERRDQGLQPRRKPYAGIVDRGLRRDSGYYEPEIAEDWRSLYHPDD